MESILLYLVGVLKVRTIRFWYVLGLCFQCVGRLSERWWCKKALDGWSLLKNTATAEKAQKWDINIGLKRERNGVVISFWERAGFRPCAQQGRLKKKTFVKNYLWQSWRSFDIVRVATINWVCGKFFRHHYEQMITSCPLKETPLSFFPRIILRHITWCKFCA